MGNIIKYIAIFLAIVAVFYFFMYNYTKIKLTHAETKINELIVSNRELKGNNDILQKELDKRSKDSLEYGVRKSENNRQIEKDKSGFNWFYDLSDNPVLINFKRMHKN